VIPTTPVRPLREVWLRPRRVFRELARLPVGVADYVLAAAQGIGNYLMLYQSKASDAHLSVSEIVLNSIRFGPIAGVAGVFLFSMIYGRLGARLGGQSKRSEVFHVLAYGGLPVVATLLLWALTFLLVGDAAFAAAPAMEVDGFVWFIVRVQFTASLLLLFWSVVLQIMGFSEILGLPVRKTFGMWMLGQLLGVLAAFFLAIVIAILFPNAVPTPP
jgi:Yip1 domain